ncbi:MAG: hypothetical protein D6717_04745 [Gammaproteobacteria bacterium]|nr:MAG: hypothetical protein D6717_04745 [Gammaproteobacteria bacterium]
MNGKLNIVFGSLYLVFTAALGPYMVTRVLPQVDEAAGARQEALSKLQLAAQSEYENQETLEPMSDGEIARMTADALLRLNAWLNSRAVVDGIKGGPHAHGNLEALLNIVGGIVLLMMTAPAWYRTLTSLAFLGGALLHSGALYLGTLFGYGWAWTLLGTGIGPLLVLASLVLLGIGAALWLRPAGT